MAGDCSPHKFHWVNILWKHLRSSLQYGGDIDIEAFAQNMLWFLSLSISLSPSFKGLSYLWSWIKIFIKSVVIYRDLCFVTSQNRNKAAARFIQSWSIIGQQHDNPGDIRQKYWSMIQIRGWKHKQSLTQRFHRLADGCALTLAPCQTEKM